MDFKQALGLLNEANAENIATQLMAMNTSIHIANKEEILAIYFTLEGLSGSTSPGSPAWNQIYQLKESAVGRMAVLIVNDQSPKKLYIAFNSAIGYNQKLEVAIGL